MTQAADQIDAPVPAPSTPLAQKLDAQTTGMSGKETVAAFAGAASELEALRTGAGVYDGSRRARLRITGEDRVRWLNGMVTNTVRDLRPGELNYTFLLNAQGRIQGDGEVYALPGALLLATDRAQVERLRAHLDHFIIMDDVELTVEADMTAVGLAGPNAATVLSRVAPGLTPPEPGRCVRHDDQLIACEQPDTYTLWCADAAAPGLWSRLTAAGAVPCGLEAVEALRILSGVPRYGADIHDKSLAQETGQARALNFNKGCYLGQEIVERVRSRATVHRALRVFALAGAVPQPGAALFAPGKPDTPVGELTSITRVCPPDLDSTPGPELEGSGRGAYALGTVRVEAAGAPLRYEGGTATALPRAPLGSH